MLTWLFPSLLYTAAAAGAPVLIHLLLRPRPRRQVFPALRLLRAAQTTSVRRQRLTHLLLLLVRVLLIGLIVLAAARPVWTGRLFGRAARQATAAVFCLDDSASMEYRHAGQTRRERVVAWADSLLGDDARFPLGSQFLVLRSSQSPATSLLHASTQAALADLGTSDSSGEPSNADPSAARRDTWTPDRAAAARSLRTPPPGRHDRGVGAMLAAARSALTARTEPLKEIYLLTDLTMQAWSDLPADAGSQTGDGPATVGIIVLDAGGTEHRDTSIHITHSAASDRHSEWRGVPGQPAAVRVSVTAGDAPANGLVELWLDGAIVGRSAAYSVAAGASREIELLTPPLTPGVHRGEARLDRSDSQPEDDSAFLAIEVATRSRVAIVSPTDAALPHSEATRIASLLAPDALPPERRPFEVDLLPSAALDHDDLSAYRTVIYIEPRQPGPARVARLNAWCEHGGSVLMIAGPDMGEWNGADAPAADPGGAVDTPGGLEFAADPVAGTASSDPTSLAGHVVFRHWKLTPHAGAETTARFANGDPAIVTLPIGAGRAAWWAFSLRNDCGDLGARAAPILTRLHRLAGEQNQRGASVANVLCDETAELRVQPETGALTIDRVAPSPVGTPITARPGARGKVRAPTEFAGLYRVNGPAGIIGSVAVNLRAEETDGRRVDEATALARFPRAAAVLVNDPAKLEPLALAAAGGREVAGYAWLAVLALVLVELGLLRRAYRPTRVGARASF